MESDDEVLYPFDPLVRSCEDRLETNNEMRKRIMQDDLEYLKRYIERGGEINCSNNLGDTALHLAVQTKSMRCIRYLLSSECVRKEIKNNFGETPLIYALRKEVPDEIILLLIENNCDVHAINTEDATALHAAVRRYTSTVAVALIKRGADIDATDAHGYTPLHEAVFAQRYENVCMLLYYNASVNEPAFFSAATPFMMAVRHTNREICELLIDYVDDINSMDAMQLHPLSIALRFNFDFYKEIVAYGGDVNHIDRNPCIFGTLGASNSEPFEFIWSRVNHKTLVGTSFLYFVFDQFGRPIRAMPNEEKLTVLSLIFDCKYIRSFIEEYLRDNSTIPGLIWKLYDRVLREISVDVRLKFLYLLLSCGVPVYYDDIRNIFHSYGYSEDVEAVLASEVEVKMPLQSVGVQDNFICRLIYENTSILDPRPVQNVDYELFYRTKTAPTLLQLGRDASRRLIYRSQQVSPNFKAFPVIKSLRIPRLLKDVLLLKYPLYRDR